MARESSFTAFIIKKQPLGEADEIVTMLAEGVGKLRAVSKSSKLSTSKLQYALQPMFLVDAAVSGNSSLPKLIRASIRVTYPNLHARPERVALWFVAAEMCTRLLPDNQPNDEFYRLTGAFLDFLDSSSGLTESQLEVGLLKFKLAAMASTGMGVHEIPEYIPGQPLLFSPSKGGFYYDSNGRGGADTTTTSESVWAGYRSVKESSWDKMPEDGNWLPQLSSLISTFMTYQLEREIKSERYL
jgi:DNA repair protein RecO